MHKQSCLILAVFLLSAVLKAETVISPKITFQSISETSTNRSRKVWIHFTDKGYSTKEELKNAIELYQKRMPARVKYRRLIRTGRWKADFTDLSVHSNYIDQVLQIGGHLRSRSRWLNAIGLEASLQQIMQIEKLPFVRSITPILTHTTKLHVETMSQISAAPPINQSYGDSETQVTQVQASFLHQKGFFGAVPLKIRAFDSKQIPPFNVNTINTWLAAEGMFRHHVDKPAIDVTLGHFCLLYTCPSPRDRG